MRRSNSASRFERKNVFAMILEPKKIAKRNVSLIMPTVGYNIVQKIKSGDSS